MKKSISTRIVSMIGLPVLVVLVILISVAAYLAMNAQKDLAYRETASQAAQYANSFDAELQGDQALGSTLAQMVETNTSRDRQEVMNALKHLLDQHPRVIGTYVGYEPNAFDGKDNNFSGSKGSDSTGRFIPYWNKLTGKETLDPLADLDTSDYYLIPKNTKADSVIEPYLYQGVLMTSFISPIMNDGKFLGIAGADTSLNSWDQRVRLIRTFKTGYALMVSNTGIFISAPDKSVIGTKTLANVAKEKSDQAIAQMAEDIKAKQAGHIETTDPFTGKDVIMFYAPIKTGGWSLVIVVPVSEMMASIYQMVFTLIIISIVAIVLLFGLIYFISKALSVPIIAMSQAANQIARGNLDVDLNIHQNDEIGQMADDFRQMTGYIIGIANSAQKIAEGDLTVEIQPQSEKDVLGNAFLRMIVNLRNLVTNVLENAESLGAASEQLAAAANQAGQATGQISTTIQQVAKGTSQQSESVNRTASSVEQMSRAIDGVAKGAQDQTQAVGKAAQVTSQIANAIQQVSLNAQAGAKGSEKAASVAQSGAQTVSSTLQRMETIQAKVNLSA